MKTGDTGMGQSFESLPARLRAQRYREMADAAFLKAQHIQDAQMRAEYLSLASGWLAMAQDIEKASDGRTQLEESQRRVKQATRKEQY